MYAKRGVCITKRRPGACKGTRGLRVVWCEMHVIRYGMSVILLQYRPVV